MTSVAKYTWITMEKCDFLFFLDRSEVNQARLTVPISRDYNRIYHFLHHSVVENEALFVLEFPLYNSIREGFNFSFSFYLKSFSQLDHQVDLSLYLMEGSALFVLLERQTFWHHRDIYSVPC